MRSRTVNLQLWLTCAEILAPEIPLGHNSLRRFLNILLPFYRWVEAEAYRGKLPPRRDIFNLVQSNICQSNLRLVISVTVTVTHSLGTLGTSLHSFLCSPSSLEGLVAFGEGTSSLSLSSWPHQQVWLSPWHDSDFLQACDVEDPILCPLHPSPRPLGVPRCLCGSTASPGVTQDHSPNHLPQPFKNSYCCEIYKWRSKWNAVISSS